MLATSAVYWESKVRIYGFREQTGLSLFAIIFPTERIGHWGTQLQAMAEENGSFDLVCLQEIDEKFMQFCVVFEEKSGCFHRQQIETAMKNEDGASLTLDFPVEMISFHGPHFQDRYGIASAAFDTLEKANVNILASGCTGTSVYIVLPENTARPAVKHLAETFIIPQANDSFEKF